METRMEKYYKIDIDNCKRTKKNAYLYKTLSDEISNLDNLPVPDTSKEIDIDRLKEIISSREEYHKQPNLEMTTNINLEELKKERIRKSLDEEKIYDINVLLENAKNEINGNEDESKKKPLSDNFLNNIDENSIKDYNKSDVSNIEANKIDDVDTNSLPLDELMDLKGNDNTIVTDPIVKEEIANTEELKENDELFYSGTLHFNKNDFEDDNDENNNHDGLKIFFLIFGILLLLAVIVLIIYKYVI